MSSQAAIEFSGAIRHPDLLLWDNWSYTEDQTIHLYSLAANRWDHSGAPIPPAQRNNYPFHWRHFTSSNAGHTWIDHGCCLEVSPEQDRYDSRTIWSGSVKRLPNGLKIAAYTGLYKINPDHKFLQNISFATSQDGHEFYKAGGNPLLCPRRDYDRITNAGYYLGPREDLGSDFGEESGPIMAWRDPYIFLGRQKDEAHLFWGAKAKKDHQQPVGVLGHATLDLSQLEVSGEVKVSHISRPIFLPDGDNFTQVELPNILYDTTNELFYLVVSTTNRINEEQLDADVDKRIRLYRSEYGFHNWELYGSEEDGSVIVDPDKHLFGLTVLLSHFQKNELLCIASYTGAAADDKLPASISHSFPVYLDNRRP